MAVRGKSGHGPQTQAVRGLGRETRCWARADEIEDVAWKRAPSCASFATSTDLADRPRARCEAPVQGRVIDDATSPIPCAQRVCFEGGSPPGSTCPFRRCVWLTSEESVAPVQLLERGDRFLYLGHSQTQRSMVSASPAKAVARKPSPVRGASPARSATPTKSGAASPLKGSGTTVKKTAPPLSKAGGGAGAKRRPPSAPKPGEFVAAKKFDGPRTGMIFTAGAHGLGYYKDTAGGSGTSSDRGTAPTSAASSEREMDAAEVFATLPLSMQVAFEARDINALDAALSALPPEEAEVHMHRCVSSGLWDPNGGGAAAEQEPSPTGESDGPPASAQSSPAAAPTASGLANAEEEEAVAAAEAAALAARNGSGGDHLFERGPYRAGGAGTDAAKRAAKPQGRPPNDAAAEPPPEVKAPAEGKAAANAAPVRKGKPAPASSSSKIGGGRGGAQVNALQEQLESAHASLKLEQATRMAAETELDKANGQVQRLLTKLDEAERFKSDEARAMSAARDSQRLLKEENDKLRRLLATSGKSSDEIEEAMAAPAPAAESPAQAKTDSSAAKADSSAFDAVKASPDAIEEIGFPPASLDPDVVLASLPQTMQDAFDALDVAALHAALAALPPAEASEYMRRCVASGLWDPNGAGAGATADAS